MAILGENAGQFERLSASVSHKTTLQAPYIMARMCERGQSQRRDTRPMVQPLWGKFNTSDERYHVTLD